MGWGCAGNQLGAEGGRAVADKLPHMINFAYLNLGGAWCTWHAMWGCMGWAWQRGSGYRAGKEQGMGNDALWGVS